MAHHHSYKASVKKLPATSEVEIKSEISAAEFGEAVKDVLSHIKKEIDLPGFRKGTAPEKLVREKVGDGALLKEAAEHAISHAYGHIIEAEKIDAIGYPKVSITKIAEGNPLEFTIVTAVVPEVKSFAYAKIAAKENGKKAEAVVVSDADLDKAIEDIKKQTSTTEITDESVKKWGEFKDVADFKAKLKTNLQAEKEHRASEKKRIELVDALTKELEVVVPEVLVESELGRMANQMSHDIERMGLKFDDYLKHLKKTPEDLKKEWRPDALKRVKLDLILSHVAKEEKIVADKAKVDAEVKHATEHHKDVDPARAQTYFEQIFLNQAVFEFLEKQK
ncbi:MAG TPA: trigger factor [Candidatus Paceibacterota bacterium]|nr:trigger factor [Candidatus Paceibacterota bacterium]